MVLVVLSNRAFDFFEVGVGGGLAQPIQKRLLLLLYLHLGQFTLVFLILFMPDPLPEAQVFQRLQQWRLRTPFGPRAIRALNRGLTAHIVENRAGCLIHLRCVII